MTRILSAATALALAVIPATAARASTCVAGACLCDSPCTGCPVVCVWIDDGPYVGCFPTTDFVACV